jgi:uncharacterized protein with FMN-binding domain
MSTPPCSSKHRGLSRIGTDLRASIVRCSLTVLLGMLLAAQSTAADVIEFLSGAKVRGTITEINKAERIITIDATIAGRTMKRKYPYQKIHVVTYRGKQYELNSTTSSASAEGSSSGATRTLRTRADIENLINDSGRTRPDWFDQTPLEYPKTLDLSWPQPPPKGWDNQKNVGQYVWDIINSNPGRWRGGVRFMHHLLVVHKDKPALRVRTMKSLGSMYFRFFQDYARAAFWWRNAGVGKSGQDNVALAECYWRLGNKNMAAALIDPRRLSPGMVKLYGDMGNTSKALAVAEAYVRAGGDAQQVYLLAGDACRRAGDYRAAMRYYEKVLSAQDARNEDYDRRAKDRARDSLEAIRLFDQFDLSQVAEGTYTASSPAYNGPVEVRVKVAGNRIESVEVTRHTEKQFYSALTDTTAQIIQKQSVKGVDATSRATVTSVAIVNATAKALAIGAGKLRRRRPSRPSSPGKP